MELYDKFSELISIVDPLQYKPEYVLTRKNSCSFYANFFLAYLSYYDKKFNMNKAYYNIENLEFDALRIATIHEAMDIIKKLSEIFGANDDKYKNVIVKYIVNLLKEEGNVKHEVSFIAAFTNAYLYKLGYYNMNKLRENSGSDFELVENILIVFGILDDILGIKRPIRIINIDSEILI